MNSLVTSPFSVIEGSSNSVILVEFKDFTEQCIEHETHIPFFEIFDIKSQAKYTHFINGRKLKRNSDSSGLSFYMNKVGYGVEVKSKDHIHCELLGINPIFFNKILGTHQLNGFLLDYQKEIKNKTLQGIIERLVLSIKSNLYESSNFSKGDIQSYIDQQVIFLLKWIEQQHISSRVYDFSNRQISEIIEYFDDKIKSNHFFKFEELIDDFSVENPLNWLDSFEKTFKKKPYQYYMGRKIEILNQKKDDDERMLLCNQKRIFELIHELVTSQDSSLRQELAEHNNSLIPFLAKKLNYQNQGTFKNHCKAMSIKAYHIFLCMEYAKNLLLTTNKEIPEIADLCGYLDARYFRRVFKNKTDNLTPEQFRERFKTTPITIQIRRV
ncbi:MAG TPA: hypothetical protein DCL61_23000 [Cyanobacteria bacterium UBA12227]|nr:hypothetical protein [Cyanobacteria bacterium UBA12227]HAX86999.1 hypothetical protein [Cyanobacteria bacterium UBA11370]